MRRSFLQILGYRPVEVEKPVEPVRHTEHHNPHIHRGLHMTVRDGKIHYREKSSIRRL
jgi:hypothetical protein